MADIVKFLRANPQVLLLLIISVVLGVGTFLAVVFGLLSSGPGTYSGEPSGSVAAFHTLLSQLPFS
jgi:hypothetical protein